MILPFQSWMRTVFSNETAALQNRIFEFGNLVPSTILKGSLRFCCEVTGFTEDQEGLLQQYQLPQVPQEGKWNLNIDQVLNGIIELLKEETLPE